MCNALIDAVNARFGFAIQRVNPTDWATPTSSSAHPAFGDGPLAPRIDGLQEVLPKPVPAFVRLQRL
jgi:hypothetical protein